MIKEAIYRPTQNSTVGVHLTMPFMPFNLRHALLAVLMPFIVKGALYALVLFSCIDVQAIEI